MRVVIASLEVRGNSYLYTTMVHSLLNCNCTYDGKWHNANCLDDRGAGKGKNTLDADGWQGLYRTRTGDWGGDNAAEPEHASQQVVAGRAAGGRSAGAAPLLYVFTHGGSGYDRSDG